MAFQDVLVEVAPSDGAGRKDLPAEARCATVMHEWNFLVEVGGGGNRVTSSTSSCHVGRGSVSRLVTTRSRTSRLRKDNSSPSPPRPGGRAWCVSVRARRAGRRRALRLVPTAPLRYQRDRRAASRRVPHVQPRGRGRPPRGVLRQKGRSLGQGRRRLHLRQRRLWRERRGALRSQRTRRCVMWRCGQAARPTANWTSVRARIQVRALPQHLNGISVRLWI